MALAQDFQSILDSLPDDWTDLEVDLRIDDESRYIDAAVQLSFINAQPYSKAEWHWRLMATAGLRMFQRSLPCPLTA